MPVIYLGQITNILTVDFETSGLNYTVMPQEYVGNSVSNLPDYWTRTDGSDITPYDVFSNYQGTYFFAGEDFDNISGTECAVVTSSVDVSGYNNLQIILLAGGCEDASTKEGEEFLKIQYQYDGSGYTTLAQFLGNGTYFKEDANADGIVDGADLKLAMQEFTYNIPSGGTSLQVRIYAYGGGSEEIAFDNIRIVSNAALPVELISFSALQLEDAVKLFWETATEVNNFGFQVERKKEKVQSENDGTDEWINVGFVAGHGNSNSLKSYEFLDQEPPAGNLQYRLKQIDTDGSYEYYGTIVEVNNNITSVDNLGLPVEFALKQNYPNPFNPNTKIVYSIPNTVGDENFSSTAMVTLKVYDILGREVATLVNKRQAAGRYEVDFNIANGVNLPSGVYIYKLQAGDKFSQVRKMALLK